MFLHISTPSYNGVINLNQVKSIKSRPQDDARNDSSRWEVIAMFDHRHEINPITGVRNWIGTYDIIFSGSSLQCTDYIEKLIRKLPKTIKHHE